MRAGGPRSQADKVLYHSRLCGPEAHAPRRTRFRIIQFMRAGGPRSQADKVPFVHGQYAGRRPALPGSSASARGRGHFLLPACGGVMGGPEARAPRQQRVSAWSGPLPPPRLRGGVMGGPEARVPR